MSRVLTVVTMLLAGLSFSSCTKLDNAAAPSCAYGIAPNAASFGPAGGQGEVAVDAEGVCQWSVSSQASWVRVTNGTGGAGPGTITYTVTPNASANERTARLSVADQTTVISQDGAAPAAPSEPPAPEHPPPPPPPAPTPPPPDPGPTPPAPEPPVRVCSYAITNSAASVPASGASGTITVVAATGCAWTAIGGTEWISVSGASGAGDGSVSYSVAPNPSTNSRSATLWVAEQAFTITQAGAEPPPPPEPAPTCTFSINPTSRNHGDRADSGDIQVNASSSSCAWTATSNADWIIVRSGSAGAGDGEVQYEISRNRSDDQRTGTITVAELTFTISQRGDD
jgi:hypothetical protein